MSELQSVPRLNTPAAVSGWIHQTARSDEPSSLVSWAASVDRQAGPGSPADEPPRITDLVARQPWADESLPLTHDIALPAPHPSWDWPDVAPNPMGTPHHAGMPSWWHAGIRTDFTALVVRADRTRAELRTRATAARKAGMPELARTLDAQADRWAALGMDALGFAAGWEIAPLRRWWEQQAPATNPTPNKRKAGQWV